MTAIADTRKGGHLADAPGKPHARCGVHIEPHGEHELVGAARGAWHFTAGLASRRLASIALLLHEVLPSPELRHAEQDLDARSLCLEEVVRHELEI